MGTIYVSDLDGTLLRNDATLSEYSRKVLKELLEDGVNFTIASARGITSIKTILKDLPLKLPVIEHNGAYITNYHTGEHLIVNEISSQITGELLNLIHEHGSTPLLSAFDGHREKLYYREIINEGMRLLLEDKANVHDHRLEKIEELSEALNEKIVTFTVINKEEKLINLVNILEEKYKDYIEFNFGEDQYYPGWHWLTINSKEATKAKAIVNLTSMLGLDKEDITVFGDNFNDIPMFKIAKKGVAVKGAKEELKIYATSIIGSNENNSVAKYIWEKEHKVL